MKKKKTKKREPQSLALFSWEPIALTGLECEHLAAVIRSELHWGGLHQCPTCLRLLQLFGTLGIRLYQHGVVTASSRQLVGSPEARRPVATKPERGTHGKLRGNS